MGKKVLTPAWGFANFANVSFRDSHKDATVQEPTLTTVQHDHEPLVPSVGPVLGGARP